MQVTANTALPRARRDRVVVRRLDDEILVYDLDAHRAVCLNETAAAVWQDLNGRRNLAQLARRVSRLTGAPANEPVVWLALERLHGAGLLDGPLPSQPANPSRRSCLRQLVCVGLPAAVLPTVVAVMAPTAAEAASVIRPSACKDLPRHACVGQPCSNGKRCRWDERKQRCQCA